MNLNYRSWGGNGPPLVLIHGLASSLHIWDYVAPLLTDHFTVIAYDQRGHGESDKPAGKYDLPTMLADLSGLISKLSLVEPVVVGHSWGATLALTYAAGYSGNCRGVALVDGGAVDMAGVPGANWEAVSRELAPSDLSSLTIDYLAQWARGNGLEHVPEPFMQDFYRSLMYVQSDGTVRPRLHRDNHMQILRAMWDTDLQATVKKVKAPMLLVLAGSANKEDDTATYAQAKKLGVREVAELNPGAKVVWLANTVHDIPLQKPERLADELIGFFVGPVR